MALFRKFRMTEEQLKKVPIQDGYFYLTTDSGNKGSIYIDWGHVRYSINSKYAQGLISEDGKTVIEIDDIYKLIQNANISSAKEYQVIVNPEDWSNSKFTWNNTELRCGPDGVTPPQISCMENEKEYLYITSADASPGMGIVFTAYKAPTQQVKLLIIDTVGGGDFNIPEGDIPNNGRIEKTMDGLKITRIDIPAGYTSGGYVALDDSIENALKEIT